MRQEARLGASQVVGKSVEQQVQKEVGLLVLPLPGVRTHPLYPHLHPLLLQCNNNPQMGVLHPPANPNPPKPHGSVGLVPVS